MSYSTQRCTHLSTGAVGLHYVYEWVLLSIIMISLKCIQFANDTSIVVSHKHLSELSWLAELVTQKAVSCFLLTSCVLKSRLKFLFSPLIPNWIVSKMPLDENLNWLEHILILTNKFWRYYMKRNSSRIKSEGSWTSTWRARMGMEGIAPIQILKILL